MSISDAKFMGLTFFSLHTYFRFRLGKVCVILLHTIIMKASGVVEDTSYFYMKCSLICTYSARNSNISTLESQK